MDIDISWWILEFLLRQNSVDDETLNNLIRVLPLPNQNSRLTKSLILRKLELEIEKGTVSERILLFLEQLEELDHMEGVAEVSAVMRAAYGKAMMHCVEKLVEEIDGDKKNMYASRICEMERYKVGLVSEDLVLWARDIDARVSDHDYFEKGDVLKSVLRYVNEAKEKIGPPFLEMACEIILNNDELSESMGLNEVSELRSAPTDVLGVSKDDDEAFKAREVSELNNQSKDNAPNDDANANSKGNEAVRAHEVSKLCNQIKDNAPTDDANPNSKGNDVYPHVDALKAHVLPTHEHVATKRCRGAKIVDPLETSNKKYDYIPTPEVSKVQEALESSSFELHALVKDPLPDALRLAESLKASMRGGNEAHDLVGGNLTSVDDDATNSSHDRKRKAVEANGDDDIIKDQNKRTKPSFLERNNTAHTTEWRDSIDSSEEGSQTRPHLPTPQERKVSPLNIYKMEKLVKHRKKRRWTVSEEDTLRTGVQKYGKGNWKLILSVYRDMFEDRTEVDLKDKWRNLTR